MSVDQRKTAPTRSSGPSRGRAGKAIAASGPASRRNLPTRNRRYGVMLLGVLTAALLGLVFAVAYSRAGDTQSVITIADTVARGQTIERSDLVSSDVAGVDDTFAVADVDEVIGQTAAVDMVAGQVLTSEMVSEDPVPGAGEALVGLSLEPARVPGDGLEAGDSIRVIAVPPAEGAGGDALDDPTVLVDAGRVYAIRGGSAEGGTQRITVVVPADASTRVAAYAASGRVAVIKTVPTQDGAG